MSENKDHEIVQRFHAGQSQREISRALGVGRSRVSRVIGEHRQARDGQQTPLALPQAKQKRKSQLDQHEESMRELLARYPNITGVRMFEHLQQRGYQGSYWSVRNRLRTVRPLPVRPLVQRFETGPGAQAQMDYAQYDLDFTLEGRRRVYLFSYVLAWSRRQYIYFTEKQDFTTTVRQHVRAFEYLGGIAATCLYDNMKVVVSRYESDLPVYNTRFLAFATHYGYRPVACRPRRPQTKGKVERPFFYIETNFLNARTFDSLEHLNECANRWLVEVADVRIHRTTERRPMDLHAEELAHLIPLPANPYDSAEVVYRSVDTEGLVSYRQNQYSVPWRHVGQVLPLRITEKELIVYGPDIQEIARHRLLPSNTVRQRQILSAHRPKEDASQQDAMLQESFGEFGEIGKPFLDGLLAAHRYGKAQARKILALRAHYHQKDLTKAFQRAVTYGAYSVSAIERILSVQAEPKTTLDTLADHEKNHLSELLKDATVRPRETADYQKLLFEEKNDGQENEPEEESTDEEREDVEGPDHGALPDSENPHNGPATG
jgi:transposase